MVKVEHVNCIICEKDDTEFLFSARDRQFGLPGEFKVLKCRDCGLVYLNPRPTKGEITKYYPDRYGPHQLILGTIIKHNRFIWQHYIQLFTRKSDPWSLEDLSKGKILDVGCGSGADLKKLRDKGWETYGVDISSIAVKHARKLGLDVFSGELNEAMFPNGYFDVIVMKYALEHMHNPLKVLNEAHRILRDDGLLVIGVPNINSMEAKIFKGYWYHLDVPRHLYHFSPHTLELLLKKSKFSIRKIDYETLPSGINGSLNYLPKKKITRILSPIAFGPLYAFSTICPRLHQGLVVIHASKMINAQNL
jgi:SAM-dependent methyltransferase